MVRKGILKKGTYECRELKLKKDGGGGRTEVPVLVGLIETVTVGVASRGIISSGLGKEISYLLIETQSWNTQIHTLSEYQYSVRYRLAGFQ